MVGSRNNHKPGRDRQLKKPKVKGIKAKRIARRARAEDNERDRQNDDFMRCRALGIPVETAMAMT